MHPLRGTQSAKQGLGNDTGKGEMEGARDWQIPDLAVTNNTKIFTIVQHSPIFRPRIAYMTDGLM